MEGKGTTYGFTFSVLLHIAFLLCVVGCVTWLGTILQMGSEMGFQTWFGFAIHPVRTCLAFVAALLRLLFKTTPKWGIKRPLKPPWVVLCPLLKGIKPPLWGDTSTPFGE